MKTSDTYGQRGNGVFQFFLSAFVFSWVFFLIGHYTNQLFLILFGIWAPSLLALLWTFINHGKTGLKKFLKRFGRVNVAWYWWILLLLLPAAIHLAGKNLWTIIYNGQLDFSVLPLLYWPGAIIPSILIAGVGEELGWRGYALPRLQKQFSPLVASLILGIVHFLWHLPTYWLGQGIHNVPALFALLFILPWSIIFTWIYNKSGGSLLFAVGFHAISNASLAIVRFMPLESQVAITPDLITQLYLPTELAGPYLSVVAVYLLAAVLVLLFGNFKEANTDLP